ncbi:MAG: DUF3471 domain-containing protein [Sediminibacterium sp.]|jgi:hypothetical protein|nr:MAG: DUF3471 domain-containing protein [Sediminibacterium sp.]
MKKIFLMAVISMGIMATANAQTSNLKDYLGKYVFPEGSPVTEVTITAEDTVLTINSAMGSTPLEKKGVDTFYLAAYDAPIIFKRGADNAVETLTIIVQGMELTAKRTAAAFAIKEEDFYAKVWVNKNF